MHYKPSHLRETVMFPRYSIVIPVLNAKNSLEMVFRCLEAQNYPFDGFECIVIDDGSTDGIDELVRNYKPHFQLTSVFHNTNLGRAAARNTGWRRARGEIVIFLDADTLPDTKWLFDYDRAFESRCDVVSGTRRCIEINPSATDFQNRLCSLLERNPQDLLRDNVQSQFVKLQGYSSLGPYYSRVFERLERELRTLCLQSPQSVLCGYSFMTSNVAVRRSLLKRAGGFDSFLRRAEDTDLGIRLWELGAQFGYAEGAVAFHLYDPDQTDRDLSYGEYLSFFYRNPYRLVLLLYFWLREYDSLKSGAIPLVSSLAQLVERSCDESGADIVEEYCSRYKFIAPIDCRFTKDELIRCYQATTGMSNLALETYLDQAVAGGLYIRRAPGKTLFDLHITSNWLRHRSTFQEEWIKATSYSRLHKTRFAKTKDHNISAICKYRGTYEMHVDGSIVPGNRVEALANIPIPIAGHAQIDVEILNCQPPDLMDYVDPRYNMISRYAVPNELGDVKISYDFVCTVREITQPRGLCHNDEISNYSLLSWSSKWHPKLRSILNKIDCANLENEYQRARAIYKWVLDNTFYSSTPFPDTTILDIGCGTCIDQTRMFVNLCRLAGIPARECCGALLLKNGAGFGEKTFEMVSFAVSPFAHSWAECYIADLGWIPVEFIGQSYGERVLRPLNVQDQMLKSELASDTALYDDYYFGALDPYRIHVSSEVSAKYMYPIFRKEQTPTNNRRLLSAMQHRLTCELVRYTENN